MQLNKLAVKTVLHVGCGRDPLPEWLHDYQEVRLDIDPACEPHIVASMLALGDIGEFDALFCSHAVEHLYPHQVPVALGEFRRVLKDGGFAVIFVPDLQDVTANEEVLYVSPCGPITGRDLFYGKADLLEGHPYMAHHTGFVQSTLESAVKAAGFASVKVDRIGCHNLIAAARK